MKSKVFKILAILCMVSQGAWAQIDYLDRSWNGTKVIQGVKQSPENATRFFSGIGNEYDEMVLSGGWYEVSGNVTRDAILVSGNPKIILCDGATLTCKKIQIYDGNSSLSIYGQSGETGKLIIDASKTDKPGIENVWGDIFMYSGNLTVQGAGSHCAGIGVHKGENHGRLTVYGGSIKSYGGEYGAGIGGGQDGDGCDVVIYGGNVWAYGGTDAAGIGTGEQYNENVSPSGGTLTVYGGHVFADGTGWGAGIGGGEDAKGAKVVINGGIVEAWAGEDAGDKNGSAIGSEAGDGFRGSLSIGDKMMVHAGSSTTSLSFFSYEYRVPACYFRPYARIEPCDHQGATYTVSGTTANDKHTLNCSHCLDRSSDYHNFVNERCKVCGIKGSISTVSIYLPEAVNGTYTDGHYASNARIQQFVKGTTIELPSPPVTYLPDGVTFAGWRIGTPEELGIKSYWVGEDEIILAPGSAYQVDSNVSLTARYTGLDISLAFDADNGETLYLNNEKKTHSVTLKGRTLYKDGKWNTLCLPFNVVIEDSPLKGDGVDVRTLEGSTFEDGVLTLNFTPQGDITTLEAGVPYIIRWSNKGTILTERDLVFTSVTIRNITSNATTENVDFIGTYSPFSLEANDRTKLYMGSDNKVYYPTDNLPIGSCCAFFSLKGLRAGDFELGQSEINSIVVNIGEETGITTPSSISSPATDNYYSLDGRKLSCKPTAKGIYIHNDKKIIIK